MGSGEEFSSTEQKKKRMKTRYSLSRALCFWEQRITISCLLYVCNVWNCIFGIFDLLEMEGRMVGIFLMRWSCWHMSYSLRVVGFAFWYFKSLSFRGNEWDGGTIFWNDLHFTLEHADLQTLAMHTHGWWGFMSFPWSECTEWTLKLWSVWKPVFFLVQRTERKKFLGTDGADQHSLIAFVVGMLFQEEVKGSVFAALWGNEYCWQTVVCVSEIGFSVVDGCPFKSWRLGRLGVGKQLQ